MKTIPEISLSICEFMKTEYTQRLSRILMKMYQKNQKILCEVILK